jgi:DNA-binding CsgD family transcriptional regulator
MDLTRVLDCLATAYQLELDGPSYVRRLAEEAVPLLDRGLGVLAYTYDARDPAHPVVHDMGFSARFDPAWLPPFYAAVEAQTDEIGSPDRPTGFAAWGHLTSGQASVVPGMRAILPHFAHLGGARDSIALNALDASGQGLWLGAPLPTTEREPRAHLELFSRLAAHLTAAVRLRRRAGPPERAAILSPRGELLHAETESAAEAREELRSAALDFDRARSKGMRADVQGATRRWRPLTRLRWSLIDELDCDGRRLVVAVENPPPTRPVTTALSEREHQVVTHAHLGRSNKEIAYELGLAHSTVRVLLHRAAAKLGASSREELLRRFDALTKPQPTRESKREPGADE